MYKTLLSITFITLLLNGCGVTQKTTQVSKPTKAVEISGTWYTVGPYNINMSCEILQDNKELILTNEKGVKANGFIVSNSHIVATEWGYLKGQLSPDKKRIDWADNTWWYRN